MCIMVLAPQMRRLKHLQATFFGTAGCPKFGYTQLMGGTILVCVLSVVSTEPSVTHRGKLAAERQLKDLSSAPSLYHSFTGTSQVVRLSALESTSTVSASVAFSQCSIKGSPTRNFRAHRSASNLTLVIRDHWKLPLDDHALPIGAPCQHLVGFPGITMRGVY